jgi:hypothetical protein
LGGARKHSFPKEESENMSRFVTLALAATLTACLGQATWSFGGQAGGGSGGGGASGSAGTSGSAAGGAAGGGAQAGATGSAQVGAGQAGAGQVGAGQVGAGQFGNSQFGAGMQGSGIGRTPFFTNPGARQQLNLDDNRFNTLNRAYQQAWNRYNQGVTGLDSNLTEQQRTQQMMQLQNQFNQSFNPALDTTFTDPRLRTRYNQLNWQFQGFGAFNDPQVRQQLDLTPQQQRQFRRLDAEWRRQMQQLRRAGNDNNPQLTDQQYQQMLQQYQQQLSTLLTPEQQQNWSQLIGQPFPIPADWNFVNLPNNPAGVVLKDGANPRVGARGQAGAGTQNNQDSQNQGNQNTVR